MRYSPLFCAIVWIFSACQGGKQNTVSSQTGGTIPLRYAENFTLAAYPEYTVATLRSPWDTPRAPYTYILVPAAEPSPAHLPQGTTVRTLLSKTIVYSSVHCGLVSNLGIFNSIDDTCDSGYIKLPVAQEGAKRGTIVDCGDGMNPDMEKIIDLHPNAILLSPFGNNGGYGHTRKLNIPIIECADYMGTSALERAEWICFCGLLLGAVPKADNLFVEVDSCYKRLQRRAMLSSVSPSVVSELKSSSAWYISDGRSTTGRLFNDACGRYVLAEDKHSGSILSAFKMVFDKAGDTDIWAIKYNHSHDMSYSNLKVDYIGYTDFKVFKAQSIYGYNVAKVPLYEETPFHPDYLLADLVQILYPEMGGLGGLRYFCKLNEWGREIWYWIRNSNCIVVCR